MGPRPGDVDGAGGDGGPASGLWAGLPATAPPRATGPDDLAYVIYTSGSTGPPRGVGLTHRGLVNHHRGVVALYGLGPGDRVLQFCSVGFDASIEEMFPSWAAGATVVYRPEDAPLLGRSWLAWLRDSRVGVLNLPTAYWHAWVRDLGALGETVPADVRLVAVGGERALGSALREWGRLGGGRSRWVNTYGPTEASIVATAWEPPPGGDPHDPHGTDGTDPPIGRPLPNVTVAVVDPYGDPVAPGATGELLIGGAGLARGYLNDPGLTAERFVPDPDREGARLYRTGDLVRQRGDGDLEYVGRFDRQVKVRGFRVECGEVEAAITAHPAVAEATVVSAPDPSGANRLVAYVVAAGPVGTTDSEVRRFLADRLPAYMVPAAVVVLDALPLNPNGKVDRDRLPPPGAPGPPGGPARTGPRSATEARMAAIWAAVLAVDVEQLGVESDFFELGGHSLLATQVIARVREEFGTETPLRAIFETPTVAGLAAAVESGTAARDQAALPPLRGEARPPGAWLPLSLAQEQMWALEAVADPPGLYNVTALRWMGAPVDEAALRGALAYMVGRHETLRTGFRDGDPPRQQVLPTAPVDLAVVDLSGLGADERGAELGRLVAESDARPFDTGRPPLFRAGVYRLGEKSDRLVVTFDHLVIDGTAAYIFLAEVVEAYEAATRSRPPDLAPIEVNFGDFVAWQRRHLTEEVVAAQMSWWARALAGMPLGPAVPFDRLPPAPTRRVSVRAMGIANGTRRLLDGLARGSGATVFMVSAAAVQALFARYSGATDIVLSTTLSGRSRAELEGLVGMFSGIGRIRTDLSGDPPFTEVVRRARDSVLGLFDNQDVPFMRVRRTLLPDFPTEGLELVAAIPTEFQYFHTAHDGRRPGRAVVEGDDQELFFRGQLHPLSVTLLDDGHEMTGEFSYKPDFYDEATVDGLAHDLERVLDAVARDPSLRLSELPARPSYEEP